MRKNNASDADAMSGFFLPLNVGKAVVVRRIIPTSNPPDGYPAFGPFVPADFLHTFQLKTRSRFVKGTTSSIHLRFARSTFFHICVKAQNCEGYRSAGPQIRNYQSVDYFHFNTDAPRYCQPLLFEIEAIYKRVGAP